MGDDDTLARWVYDTCRLFGVQPVDALEVARLFLEAVHNGKSVPTGGEAGK